MGKREGFLAELERKVKPGRGRDCSAHLFLLDIPCRLLAQSITLVGSAEEGIVEVVEYWL